MSLKKHNHYSLIIFDWDGTLVDSIPSVVNAFRGAGRDQGLPELQEAEYNWVIGMSLAEAFKFLYPDADRQLIQHLLESYKKHYEHLEQTPSTSFEGVTEGLKKIKASGTSMAVVTGKQRMELNRSIQANGYEEFFECCYTSDDAPSKPDPTMLNLVLTTLSVPVHSAIMVGDSIHDLAMASNAGMASVGVSYGAQPATNLAKHQPKLIVDHFSDFINWLN